MYLEESVRETECACFLLLERFSRARRRKGALIVYDVMQFDVDAEVGSSLVVM